MKMLMAVCLVLMGSSCFANEWVPYAGYVGVNQPVVQVQQYSVVQVPVPMVVQIPVPYVPMVTYDSVLVEQKHWCLFKRYEWVQVPRIRYIPTGR